MNLWQTFREIYERIKLEKVTFFVAFFVVVLLSYTVLVVIDFIPEPVEEAPLKATAVTEVATEPEPEPEPAVVDPYPLKIIFDALDKEVTVLNPQSREIADLDAALLEGVVRHPDSADFENTGNIFILGHSSYLPNVFNKNFQAFNGIQDMTWGDTIRLQSADMEYVYRVDKVYKAKATEVTVPIDETKERLTLATCNSFGAKDDRFMVEATLVQKKAL